MFRHHLIVFLEFIQQCLHLISLYFNHKAITAFLMLRWHYQVSAIISYSHFKLTFWLWDRFQWHRYHSQGLSGLRREFHVSIAESKACLSFLNLEHCRLCSHAFCKKAELSTLLSFLSKTIILLWLAYYIIRRATSIVLLRLHLHRCLCSWLIYDVVIFTYISKYLFSMLLIFFPFINIIIWLFVLQSSQKRLIFHSYFQ